jgi:tRNA pseudouridine55 synthase
MFGLLNLNKPQGMTSRDVVNVVQKLVHPAKAGHAGTLDPLAQGVLVVCAGPATRLIEYVQRMPKQYRAAFLLGRRSDTEDITGAVVELSDPPCPTKEEVETALQGFVGEIDQQPPIYSAKKVGGRRAYKLARSGKRPRLAARKVTIHRIDLIAYEYPELRLDVICGSGTYIRSLGRDIGRSLGSDAVMSMLTRRAIGEFHVEDAVAPEVLTRKNLDEHLIPAARAVASLPEIHVSPEEELEISQGRVIKRAGLPEVPESEAPEYAAIAADGRLAAILAPRGGDSLGPTRYFPRTT